MRKGFVMLAVLAVVAAASADVLWDNGSWITHPGTPAYSECQGGRTSAGANINKTLGYTVADDFVVGAGGWTLDTADWMAYQTGSSTQSTFTGAYVQIWDGAPNAGGQVIFGDMTTNRLTNTTWSGVYRVFEGQVGNTQRPVMTNTINLEGIQLNPGTYWLEVSLTGSLSSGPWAGYIEPAGNPAHNALQQTSPGVWQISGTGYGGPGDHVFMIHGTPEPATLALLALGFLALRRR